MSMLQKTLDKMGIIGSDGRLSITTLAFIAIVVKIITLPQLDLAAIGALLAVILNYMHRRSKAAKPEEQKPVDYTADIAELKEQVNSINELKNKVGSIALAIGLGPKK